MFQCLELKASSYVGFGGNQKGKIIYKIKLSELKSQNVKCLMFVDNEQWVWHRRLGHVSMRIISQINKLNLVRGLPNLKFSSIALCEACQKGKFAKPPFKSKNVVSTSRPLELLHIDLFGLVKTTSITGKKYRLVIVDDYITWTRVTFLRYKVLKKPSKKRLKNPFIRNHPKAMQLILKK